MALPKIDTPVYDLELPLSKKQIRFRPFLVKEQKNLMMAMEADDKETIERNIKQVLTNCTLTDGIVIDNLPVIDVEFYFTIGESNGIYLSGEMTKIDENYLDMISKLQTYYEKFKSKWAKILASRKKTKQINK